MFASIEQLQELIKSYYTALRYDEDKANALLADINELRLEIALNAEVGEIYYNQVNVPSNATGYQENVWFSKNDINYTIVRALAHLGEGVTLSAVDQGNRQRIITREPMAWQQLFPAIQSNLLGQQTLFDLPQELFFEENEALGLAVQGQTVAGYIFYHGICMKDSIEEVTREAITTEINKYLPEPELVPLVFQFPNNTFNTLATDSSGAEEIFSSKYDRSVILTEVSCTAPNTRLTLIDEGRNQLICQRVEMQGVASNYTNRFTTYYKLPRPHLLRKGDRLRIEVLNGSTITNETMAANTLNFLCFKAYSV
jgi:hypothetical protein